MSMVEEIQTLTETVQQCEAQIDSWTRHIETLRTLQNELSQARRSLEGIDKAKKGSELLLSIGYDSSIFAKLSNPDKVLSNLGSGVYVEEDIPVNIKRVDDKLNETVKSIKDYSEAVHKLQMQYQENVRKLDELRMQETTEDH